MDNEIKEMLKELLKDLGEKLDKIDGDFNLKDKINEAHKQPAKISIEKHEDGSAETRVEGSNLAILITLAGLENAVLEKLNPPKELWELIRNTTGTREAGDNE